MIEMCNFSWDLVFFKNILATKSCQILSCSVYFCTSANSLIHWIFAKPVCEENTGLPLYSSASNYCHLNMGVCYFWWRYHSEHTAGNSMCVFSFLLFHLLPFPSCISPQRCETKNFKKCVFIWVAYFFSELINPLLLRANSVFVHVPVRKYCFMITFKNAIKKWEKKSPPSCSWLHWEANLKKCQVQRWLMHWWLTCHRSCATNPPRS